MLMEYLRVFFVGGIICLIAQILMDQFKVQSPYVLVSYVTSGVVLSFLGIYGPLVKYGAAGATVPIIGFGHTLAEGVKKAIDTDGFIGIFTGGTIATAGGIAAAIFFGYTMAVLFKSKPKP
ncbi:SpoVA/SpoVAEb family sporulation membrane protein [Clostridioides mangenotii]|uniref:SpoVA/SpoVAEb family sporulation membrane protein n=1 Tax=Metaclostridioides mangenotii TaxID=1540 RepID=UPI001C0FDD24|nr:SpoVA/SpoVAEb family sporulation membrane protein [Clostridioides mangenotii]MBU5307294.1 SpoVA/SpoVAEb family sporulation membrane protein [Clostridioides mangenotii]MCR1955303.1 SpoVA/SpoVAEb family sporulation membrane protein [Clostridioides mangenotii]